LQSGFYQRETEAAEMMIEANGISTSYRLEGPAGAPVVTLSHSLATSCRMWGPQVRALSERYRVLSYDTRGHGQTEVPPPPYSLSQLVADACGLLTDLGIGTTCFVGLSMGGIIGQLLALTHPELLHSLVLCSTTARMTPDAEAIWNERIAVAREHGMDGHVDSTIGRWFTPGFVEAHPDVVDPVRDIIRRTHPNGYVGCIQAIRGTDMLERLPQIRVPTLVMVGQDDPGLSAAEAIHEHIPGSEMAVLTSSAHLCNLEQPAAFNEALLSFLARVG
jgi:3-oxoadipate enol-lactonase